MRQDVPGRARLAAVVPLVGLEGAREPLADGARRDDEGVETVGVTSGASAPESLVEDLCEWFRGHGVAEIRELAPAEENVVFKLPAELRPRTAA